MYHLHYDNAKKAFEDVKNALVIECTREIRKHGRPILLGNITIWLTTEDNNEVPAYRYNSETDNTFLPIYDKKQTYEYGWADFDEVARLFDTIHKTIASS